MILPNHLHGPLTLNIRPPRYLGAICRLNDLAPLCLCQHMVQVNEPVATPIGHA